MEKENNVWHYYNEDGTLARNKWVGNYWLGADGKMVTNAWVDNGRHYVGANGAWDKDKKKKIQYQQVNILVGLRVEAHGTTSMHKVKWLKMLGQETIG